MSGAHIIPRSVTSTVQNVTTVHVALRNSCVSLCPCGVSAPSRYPLNVGIKATEILFSANSRRNRLGIIKAIPNASARLVVPSSDAFVISLIRPSMREPSVSRESRMPAAAKDFLLICTAYYLPAACARLCRYCYGI